MITKNKIDWDYDTFYLMIIHAFCEMLSNVSSNKGMVPSQIVDSLILFF